jgi:hypothetical protein
MRGKLRNMMAACVSNPCTCKKVLNSFGVVSSCDCHKAEHGGSVPRSGTITLEPIRGWKSFQLRCMSDAIVGVPYTRPAAPQVPNLNAQVNAEG